MVVGVVVVGAFVVVLSSSSNVSSRKSVDLFIKDQSLYCVSFNINITTSCSLQPIRKYHYSFMNPALRSMSK